MHPTRPLPTVGGPAEIFGHEGWEVVPIDEVLDGGHVLVAAGRRYTLRRLTGEWTEDGRRNWDGPAKLRLIGGPAEPDAGGGHHRSPGDALGSACAE